MLRRNAPSKLSCYYFGSKQLALLQMQNQLDSNGHIALPSPPKLMRRTHTQHDGRRATQYLLCSLSGGEGNNKQFSCLDFPPTIPTFRQFPHIARFSR